MRRYLKVIALCVLAALLLWWFGRGLDWAGVRGAVAQADAGLIAAAVALVVLTYFVRALRWRALLAPLTPVSLRELFAATTVGFGAVFLVGRAGEVVRPAFLPLRDRRVRPSASFVTIGVERIYDMAAVVVLFAANLLWFRVPGGGDAAAYARVRLAGFVLLGGAVIGIAALVWFRRNAPAAISWLDARLAHAPSPVGRIGSVLTGILAQLAQALGVLVDARELAVTVGWTALLWLLVVLANWLILRAFGLPFGVSATIFVLGWELIGSLVPTPGGAAGAFHAAAAAGLVFLGVAREQAVAVSIILHLAVFAPAVVLGLYYFVRSDVSLAQLRGLVASDKGEGAGLSANAETSDSTTRARRGVVEVEARG